MDPQLPKGCLEKSEGCENSSSCVLVRRWLGQKDRLTPPQGFALCRLRPRKGRNNRSQIFSPLAWPPGSPEHPACGLHRPPSSCSPTLRPEKTQTGSVSNLHTAPSTCSPLACNCSPGTISAIARPAVSPSRCSVPHAALAVTAPLLRRLQGKVCSVYFEAAS